MPVINCVVKLKLKWTKYCVLYKFPIETLSAKDNQKLIKLINNELKKSIYCNV